MRKGTKKVVNELVPADKLIVGQEYYFDNKKKEYGIFIDENKESDTVYFKPVISVKYYVDLRGYVPFWRSTEKFIKK